jgi:integral membrane sensor domain MASE1
MGDSMGVVLFAPFLLLIATTRSSPRPTRPQWLEATILLLVLVGASTGPFISHFPLTYLISPPVIWAALRFSRLGAATPFGPAAAQLLYLLQREFHRP